MNNYYSNNDSRLGEASALVNQLSPEELNKLMNSEEEVTKLVRKIPEVQQIEATKESLKERIKTLACNNLEKEPVLNREKRKLMSLHEELARLRDEYRNIRGQYDDQTGDTNPEMIYILLQSAAAERERATEQTAEDFFYGEKTEEEVTEFERRFIEERKQAHDLKIKAEKFQELMQMSQATSYLSSNQPSRHSGFR